MSSRLRTVILAVAFGLLATLGVAMYINSVKAEIVESGVKKTVFVANARVTAGTQISQLGGVLVKTEVPKRYVAEDAVSDLEAVKNKLLAGPLSKGEQLTASKLRTSEESEVTYKLPADKIAVSIPVDDVVGVGGSIQVGDRVAVVATFAPGPGGTDISRVMLTGIEILAVGGQTKPQGMGGSQPIKRTITVAVTPAEAEKLVFAEEKGKVWVGLQAPGNSPLTPTGGQTMESVFK